MSIVEQKLADMGIALPDPPDPAGSYVPATRSGRLLFVSGQIPVAGGRVEYTGQVTDSNMGDAEKSARLCAINVLAQIKKHAPLDDVVRFVKLSGFVSSGPGFARHPQVINAASDLIFEAFGERGRHARVAVGVAGLPLDAMTEVDCIVELA